MTTKRRTAAHMSDSDEQRRTPTVPTTPRDLAVLIAGNQNPPTDLQRELERAIASIRWAEASAARRPTREQTRSRLVALLAATRHTRAALGDVDITALLAASSSDSVARDNALGHLLDERIDRIQAAIDRIPRGKGSTPYFASVGMPTLQECAVWVAMAWLECREVPPPHTSPDAWAACEAIWTMADGAQRPRAGVTLGGWRVHLEHAKALLHEVRYAETRQANGVFELASMHLKSQLHTFSTAVVSD